MLRKIAYNKIFRTTGLLLLIGLLLLFPVSKEYTLEDNITKQVIKKQENTIYLLDKDNYISRCKVNIGGFDKEKYVRNIIETLIVDGKYESIIPNGFKAILPSNLSIRSIRINNDEVIIDFSKEFYEITKEYEEKAVELLVYNLTEIEGIKKVYIKVDGKLLSKLQKNNINISQPLTRKFGVNKENMAFDYKNVTSTTIYYINKNKDNIYYVPVTKINNDKRDKIEIIIEELASSHVYEPNLMSYLNYKSKLINYKKENDKFILNFNKYIFDDINKTNILEEVVYSISLSIKDNYDVKEVIFNVNDKEITKSVLKDIE